MNTIDANALLSNLFKQINPSSGAHAREPIQDLAAHSPPKKVNPGNVLELNQRLDQSMNTKAKLYQGINNAILMVQTSDGALARVQGMLGDAQSAVASGNQQAVAETAANISRLANDTEVLGFKPLVDAGVTEFKTEQTPFALQATPADAKSLGLDMVDLGTPDGITKAQEVIEKAVEKIQQYREGMAYSMGVLEQAIESTGESQRHILAARMQVMDANYAKATAEVTHAEMLQNTTLTLLAQANTLGDDVSSLLGYKS